MGSQLYNLLKEKKYDAIIEVSVDLLPDETSDFQDVYAIAKAYEIIGDYKKSIPWFARYYRIETSDETFGMLAGVCFAAGDYQFVSKMIEEAEEGYYFFAAIYQLLLIRNGSIEEKLDALNSFLQIQEEDNYMLRLAMHLLEAGRDKESSKICKKISRLFLNGSTVDYAAELIDKIKGGVGLDFIHSNPWNQGCVFRHLDFEKHIGDGALESQENTSEDITKQGVSDSSKVKDEIKREHNREQKISPIVEENFSDVVGMSSVKDGLNSIYNLLQVGKKRKGIGVHTSVSKSNLIIVGPDGSGKTTAANIAVKVLCELGIVSSEVPNFTDYQNLVGGDRDETFENIKNLFEKAGGEAIVIDNINEFDDDFAYSLGLDAIDQIVKAYMAIDEDVSLIITGTKAGIDNIFQKKPKFYDIFDIPPMKLGLYSPEEMVEISKRIAEEKGCILDEDTYEFLTKKFEHLISQHDFKYARDVQRMITMAYMKTANRLTKKRRFSGEDALIIKVEDFDAEDSEETVEELINQLNALTGLDNVKKQVSKIVNSVKVQKKAEEMGIPSSGYGTLHLIFKGNAGTGKTTVARIIGKIYKRLGVLPSGQLIECTRRDLVAEYVGKTALQVQAKVKEAMGGILFIDEAYTLCKDDNDSFGKEAIDALVADIENHRDRLMVVLAGYSADMDKFLDQNQGLRSRLSTEIIFEDYSPEEMLTIFKKYVKDRRMVLDVGIEPEVLKLLERKSKQRDFGNARGVRNVFEEVVLNQQNRISLVDAEALSRNDFLIIKQEDLDFSTDTNGKSVEDYLNELNSLTGLASVKEKVGKIVDTVQVNKKMEEMDMPTQNFGTLHMVFKGNAGTGKTTVARLIGQIYRELGVLSTGIMIECGRSDLVAAYTGQTAIKVKSKIQEAMGGVLFIDEAYSLCNGNNDNFGQEAIDTLVADIENYRSNLMVIIAGYSTDMDEFLERNQGLSSRFSNEIIFEDYTQEELFSIFEGMVRSNYFVLSEDAIEYAKELIEMESKKKDFGNARGVRNLMDKIKEQHNVRIAEILRNGKDLSEAQIKEISKEDVLPILSKQ